MQTSIMTLLTEAILDALKAKGLDVQEINFKDLLDGTINIRKPAVNITINTGGAQRVNLAGTYKYMIIVSLIVVFNTAKGGPIGEAQRKQGIYDLIVSVARFLNGQKFGLPLENYLVIKGFRNITTKAYATAGYQLYNMDFSTSFLVDAEDGNYADEGTVESILTKYWICPPDSTNFDTPDRAADLVVLS